MNRAYRFIFWSILFEGAILYQQSRRSLLWLISKVFSIFNLKVLEIQLISLRCSEFTQPLLSDFIIWWALVEAVTAILFSNGVIVATAAANWVAWFMIALSHLEAQVSINFINHHYVKIEVLLILRFCSWGRVTQGTWGLTYVEKRSASHRAHSVPKSVWLFVGVILLGNGLVNWRGVEFLVQW